MVAQTFNLSSLRQRQEAVQGQPGIYIVSSRLASPEQQDFVSKNKEGVGGRINTYLPGT